MKAVQIYRTEQLGGGVPGQYIPQGIVERRGQQAVTAGAGALSRSLMEFGQMIQTSVRRDMVSHNYALAQKAIADTELNLQSDPDHRSIPGKFSQSLDDIRATYSDQILDPVARNMFEQKMLEYGTARELQMKYYVHAREQDAQYAHLIEELDIKASLIENVDIDDLKTYQIHFQEGLDAINQRESTGNLKSSKAVELRIAWREDTSKMRAYRSVMTDPFRALTVLSSKGWKRNFPYLSEEERLDYVKQAEVRIRQINRAVELDNNQAKADQKALDERMREQTRKDFIKRIEFPNTAEGGPLTPLEVIDNQELNSKDIEHFLTVMKDKAASKIKDKKSIYDTTNEALFGKWNKKVYLEPESIESIDEIWKDHGKGLSTANVIKLSERWEQRTELDSAGKSTTEQRAGKSLERRRTFAISQEVGSDVKVLDTIEKLYNEYQDEVELYFDKHPDADDKEIMEYILEMTNEEDKGIWKTWFNYITRSGLPPSQFPMIETKPDLEKADTERSRAIKYLQNNNQPVTEANIKYVMENQ